MKKRVLVYISFIFLIASLIVFYTERGITTSHLVCGNEDDIMIRLSSETNAHGEIFNGSGNYTTEVCFSDIYGVSFTGNNPHQCLTQGPDALNSIIRLSKVDGISDYIDSNAHAEGPDNQSAAYLDICYGNLQCDLLSTGEDCSTLGPGYTKILALSSTTNAHIELADQTNYLNYICCTILGEFIGTSWTDYAGSGISLSYLGNTVKMAADTTFPNGIGPIIFEIIEGDGFLNPDDDIRTVNGLNHIEGIVINGKAIGEWTITQEDLDKTNDLTDFFFTASFNGEMIESGKLEIINGPDPNNFFPRAVITSPEHRQIYFNGTNITFSHESFDSEGPLDSIMWDIQINNEIFHFNEDSINFSFPESGQATITLTVIDMGGLNDQDQIAILILNSPGMLAFINDPFHQMVVTQEDLIVDFNASDSYVVLSEGDSCDVNVTCLAGICPNITKGIPDGCALQINVSQQPIQTFADLYFLWEFDDGSTFESDGLVYGQKAYGIPSNSLNDKSVDLTINYTDVSQDISLEFSTVREFTVGLCVNNGATVLEVDTEGNIIDKLSTLIPEVCSVDGNFLDQNDCCPTGKICTPEGCVTSAASRCLDYEEPGICEADPSNVAINDPLYDQNNCGETIGNTTFKCYCAWETTSESCGFVVEGIHDGGPEPGDICTEYTCLQSYTTTPCTGGEIIVTVTANFNAVNGTFGQCEDAGDAQDQCVGGIYTVACDSQIIKLSFVDNSSILFTAFGLFLIYLFIVFKKRYYGNKKNNLY